MTIETNEIIRDREITKAAPQMQSVADEHRHQLPENRWWWDASGR
ncbi:MAG: hypothetical protein R3C11_21600 [Planctomycetaceae bacterium]